MRSKHIEVSCPICDTKFITLDNSHKKSYCSDRCVRLAQSKFITETRTGVSLSNTAKKNMRISAIRRIEEKSGQVSPNYNQIGCIILNDHMKVSGSFIQHAENGGEFRVPTLGYWVDGYDKENNIVYEVDEGHHFNKDESYTERDIRRHEK